MHSQQLIPTNTVVYWKAGAILSPEARAIIESQPNAEAFLQCVQSFNEGTKIAKPKKGKHPGVKAYGLNVNKSQRLLGPTFEVEIEENGEKFIAHGIYITDVVLDHDVGYATAICLNISKEQKQAIIQADVTQHTIAAEMEKRREKNQAQNSTKINNSKRSYRIRYVPIEYTNKDCFTLNEYQQRFVTYYDAAIISSNHPLRFIFIGPARTGKTSFIDHIMQHASPERRLIFITQSEKLKMKKQGDFNTGFIPGVSVGANVEFLTPKELLQRIYPNKKILIETEEDTEAKQNENKETCQAWIKEEIKNFITRREAASLFPNVNLLNPYFIYSEFRIMSGYTKWEYIGTNEDGTKNTKVGERSAIYNEEQRKITWDFNQTYHKHLSDNNMVHAALVKIPPTLSDADVLLDEFPDLSMGQLEFFLRYAEKVHFICVGDPYQQCFDRHLKQKYLVNKIEELSQIKIEIFHLPYTNDSSSQVDEIVSGMLDLKLHHDKGRFDDSQYTEIKSFSKQKEGFIALFSPSKEMNSA
ncbi:MAG: hypothetical protein JO149_04610, partial [Gammaproteobacteria bacterium]|nr:hypothetical protein [Gammaproteobacteria bacterium]